jgi:hypothetical protein
MTTDGTLIIGVGTAGTPSVQMLGVFGSATTGKSGTNLDMSTGSGTTGKHLRIMRIVDDGVNTAGAYAVVEVTWAEHALKGVVSGVGGI